MEDTLDRGRELRLQMGLGSSTPPASALAAEYQDFVDRYIFGAVWARPGIDLHLRSCVTVAMLLGSGQGEQLAIHLRTARKNGVTLDELHEILVHAVVYCGAPKASTGFRLLREMQAEEAAK
jgi:alkylhydroperoxidase/carboxymuconolactone decarboxylase family protein YurZ